MNITGMSKAYDEENFGPMLQVQFVDTFEEAIKAANNTKYGLAAGLISDNKNLFNEFVDMTAAFRNRIQPFYLCQIFGFQKFGQKRSP